MWVCSGSKGTFISATPSTQPRCWRRTNAGVEEEDRPVAERQCQEHAEEWAEDILTPLQIAQWAGQLIAAFAADVVDHVGIVGHDDQKDGERQRRQHDQRPRGEMAKYLGQEHEEKDRHTAQRQQAHHRQGRPLVETVARCVAQRLGGDRDDLRVVGLEVNWTNQFAGLGVILGRSRPNLVFQLQRYIVRPGVEHVLETRAEIDILARPGLGKRMDDAGDVWMGGSLLRLIHLVGAVSVD